MTATKNKIPCLNEWRMENKNLRPWVNTTMLSGAERYMSLERNNSRRYYAPVVQCNWRQILGIPKRLDRQQVADGYGCLQYGSKSYLAVAENNANNQTPHDLIVHHENAIRPGHCYRYLSKQTSILVQPHGSYHVVRQCLSLSYF